MLPRISQFKHLATSIVAILLCSIVYGHIRVDNSSGLNLKIKAVALKYVGICELTGRNDGPFIEAIQKSVNAPIYTAYCAAFIDSVLREAGVKITPRTAWSPSFFPKNRRIIWAGQQISEEEPEIGDIDGYFFPRLKRIGHVGIDIGQFGDFYDQVEANTSNALTGEGLRNGGCILRKNVHKRRLYAHSRWKDN